METMETNSSLRFAYRYRTSPIDFALLGRKQKCIKSKTTAKLKGKKISIAAVRDQFLSFATFQTPLFSRYRLPLSGVKVNSGLGLPNAHAP
jgi:hypothetical protein